MSTDISFAVSSDVPREVPPELVRARLLGRRLNSALYDLGFVEEVPAEIAALPENTWGRPPKIFEVAGLHKMLTSRRNEALLATGLSLCALYLADRSLHHEQ
jgi:hypothetical protein